MIIEEPTASYRVCDVWMQTLGKTNLFSRSSTIVPLALCIPTKTDKLFFYSGKNYIRCSKYYYEVMWARLREVIDFFSGDVSSGRGWMIKGSLETILYGK